MYPLTVGLAISSPRLWEEAQAELQSLPVRVVMEYSGRIEDPVGFVEKVDRFRPDVLILEPALHGLELVDILPSLKATSSSPAIVIIRETATPEDILKAMRAGANEYLYSPLSKNLAEALERISRARAARDASSSAQGKLIGVLSVKGGCGGTTLACHAAVELARLSGQSVLLADFDFASGLVRILMRVKSRYSVLDAISNTQRLDPSFWQALVSNGYKGVEVIAGSSSEFMKEHPKSHEIRQVIRFARSQYGHVIVDLGAGLDPNVASVLEEVDELLLVATPEVPALQMTKLVVHHLLGAGFRRDRIRLVVNRMSRRVELSAEEMEGAIGISIHSTLPNDYNAIDQAYSAGNLLPENNHVRVGIRRLVGRIAGIGQEATRKRFSFFGS
jgi:pilus assembly protein CpaE